MHDCDSPMRVRPSFFERSPSTSHRWRRFVTFLLLTLATPLLVAAAAPTPDPAPLLLILDASGSMWGQIEGENKIVIARRVLSELVGELGDDATVGLVAYGHRREGDCDDIETLAPLGPLDRSALVESVNGINPKGKTPITAAVEHSLAVLAEADTAATVVLLSDGLETCGGDPCEAVRLARESGSELLLHVIGFDVEGEDLSQLQCMAQAGGGLFLSAENADQLADALDTAIALGVETPAGRLVVRAVADGELQDVSVSVSDRTTGEQAAVGRTYTRAETNPLSLPLPDGRFDVRIRAVGLKGDVERHFEIEIADGSTVEKSVDFGTGELSVGVARNSELGDATVKVYPTGTRDQVSSGRTYTRATSNPSKIRLTAGTYDVVVTSVEIANKPSHTWEGVELPPGGTAEVHHEFASGTLRVGAVAGGERVDVTVSVVDLESEKSVAQGRTYTAETSNPKSFELAPGRYRVSAKAVRMEGKPQRQTEVTVVAGESQTIDLDFGG